MKGPRPASLRIPDRAGGSGAARGPQWGSELVGHKGRRRASAWARLTPVAIKFCLMHAPAV